MNHQLIRDLVQQLQKLQKRFDNGFKNDVAIETMGPVLTTLERECSGIGYLTQKLASARHNFETMFSARKHSKYGGADEVANRFRFDLLDVIQFVDSQARQHKIRTEGEP